MKIICLIWLLNLSVLSGAVFAKDPVVEAQEHLKANFPKLSNIIAVEATPVVGVYAVAAGKTIFYYSPASKAVFFGELWSEGKSLTSETYQKWISKEPIPEVLTKPGAP